MKKNYSTERGKMQPATAAASTNIEIGKTYMYKGKEVEAILQGAEGYTQIKPVGSNNKFAVKNSDLTEKTNDSYTYIVTKFNNFKY
jgi:hypothetical protein